MVRTPKHSRATRAADQVVAVKFMNRVGNAVDGKLADDRKITQRTVKRGLSEVRVRPYGTADASARYTVPEAAGSTLEQFGSSGRLGYKPSYRVCRTPAEDGSGQSQERNPSSGPYKCAQCSSSLPVMRTQTSDACCGRRAESIPYMPQSPLLQTHHYMRLQDAPS